MDLSQVGLLFKQLLWFLPFMACMTFYSFVAVDLSEETKEQCGKPMAFVLVFLIVFGLLGALGFITV